MARALLTLVLLLTGCRDTAEPPRPAPGEPIRVVFKHMRMYGDATVLDGILADFEARHPGVDVVSEILPNDSDLQHQFFVTNLEGGERDFDVMNIDIVWVPEFARAGWVLDLSDRLPPERVRAEFFAGPAAAVTFQGKTWAVPWFIDTGLLYWHKDLLEKHGFAPPRTWTDLATTARFILEREGDPSLKGFVWQGKQYEGLVCAALEVIWGFGGDVIDAGGRVTFDTPETIRALAYLRALLSTGLSPGQTTSADEEVARTLFNEGHAVFMRNWPYAWSLVEREGSPVRGKVGFGPMLAEPGATGGGTLGGWQLAINRHTPSWKRDAAWALVEHLASPEVARRIARAYSFKPARVALYSDPAYLAEEPFAAALKPALEKARPRPVTPYYLMISQVLQSEISAAVSGIRGPEETAREGARQVRHIMGVNP